ncbi:DUF1963 domain-containing protein [Actinoplanes sichuanensis]|uniref:DUF1963 domain-containing protein n=1 Tax=Actinoplanes sichuanensis TaxID=512349 RepID=A0ABW4AT99_9ACTN|nr:DUF1963 domain-containing protein [Actinoplanes sichuanensis]BEL05272.1 DUF1963 domain-containing protein [Actinoplanes sichuanensis]
MDYHGQFRRTAIERGIPADEVERFAEFLRFAIWTGEHRDGPLVGRAGGLPRLPAGMEWPSSGHDPLPFIAEIDCAALPRVGGLPLPADGTLLFFLHHENAHDEFDETKEQRHARVVYLPAGTDTVTADEPADTDGMFCNTRISFIGRAHDLRATVHAELPGWLEDDEDLESYGESRPVRHLGLDLSHLNDLRALAAELWPDDGDPGFALGGYTSGIGEMATDFLYTIPETGMAEAALEARGAATTDVDLEQETVRVMREWVPLAQFVPDDVYIGRFLIRYDDLAAACFDRALSFTAFTE